MNKILNINLGGYALTIDDDAYEYLNSYLDSIRRRFRESEGRDEIVSDIEARLGELINQDLGNRTIVMLPDVESAVKVMGKPEDFGGEPAAEPASSRSNTGTRSPRSSSIRTGKRLFRDPDNVSVSGVCSGLAAYFGMSDPVWMRLIFVILTVVSTGFWILAYVLLWILVPEATTAADRLAMRGEPVNMENIAKEVEEGFERLGQQVNQVGTKGAAPSGLSRFLYGLGQLFGFLIRLFVKFWILIAILVVAALFIGLLVAWASGIFALATAAPFLDYLSPFSNGVTWMGAANLFFLFGIPIFGLCLVTARTLFKLRSPTWLGRSLVLFWVLNVFCAFFLVTYTVTKFRQNGTLTKNVDLSAMNSDTLRVETSGGFEGHNDFHIGPFDEEGLRLSDDRLEINGPIEINVQRSASGRFECTQSIRAHGPTNSNAVESAGETEYSITTSGNTLQVPTSYSILRGHKWRAQEVRVVLSIPVGKYVVFGKKINDYVHGRVDYANPDDNNYIYDYPDQVFRMTQDGLVCAGCPQFGDRDYREDRNYEKFILEGDFETEIRKGDNFKMRIEGSADAIRKIRTGDELTLTTKDATPGSKVKVYIETPTFTSLHADNTGEVVIRGFEEGQSRITARGTSRIRAYLESNNLDLSLSGKCQVELTGKGNHLEASLSEGAILDASNWRVDDAEISASDNSKARVNVRNNVKINSDDDSQVKVEGGAEVQHD
ncbi:MAG: DUF2807 domain-containing protein [Saprospiraceae bacterium]